MKATSRLGWKSFVSNLHRPMLIAPKESARLLALLNTSFQQQLDRQHPVGLEDYERNANLHLRSVLTNPLFNRKNHPRGRLSRVQELLERPMGFFADEVAAGSATLETAALCLQSQYNKCIASVEADLAVSMRASGAGTTVREWLWSSGLEESGDFLTRPELVHLMIKFLTTESQHERLWLWLQKLQSDVRRNPSLANYQSYRRFLLQHIGSEESLGDGLKSAIALFIKVAENARQDKAKRIFSALYANACDLTIKLINTPDAAMSQDPIVEHFMKVVKTVCDRPDSYLDALHDVYLTETPKLTAALGYFGTLSNKDVTLMKPLQRSHKVQLGLRLADTCLHHGRQAEAISVMKILQAKFSNELGLPPPVKRGTPQRSSTKSEEQNLHLLDTLVIA